MGGALVAHGRNVSTFCGALFAHCKCNRRVLSSVDGVYWTDLIQSCEAVNPRRRHRVGRHDTLSRDALDRRFREILKMAVGLPIAEPDPAVHISRVGSASSGITRSDVLRFASVCEMLRNSIARPMNRTGGPSLR